MHGLKWIIKTKLHKLALLGGVFMSECGTLTYNFETKEDAIKASKIISAWANKNLQNPEWVGQLFPVSGNQLFVGDNTYMEWDEYDGKINRLADVLLKECPGMVFSGDQSYINMTTGFEFKETFSCDGNKVEYETLFECAQCGTSLNLANCFNIEDLFFCDEQCAKMFLVEKLLEEDEFDEDELEEMELDELIEIWNDYN